MERCLWQIKLEPMNMGNRINAAVEEIIRKFVKNPKFEEEIRKLIGGSIDTSELDREYDGLNFRYI